MFESNKRHRAYSSKQVSYDFLPFFFICAFLVVIICLVSKQPKERNDEEDDEEVEEEEEEEEDEEEQTQRISSMPKITNETITGESSASSVCSVAVDPTDYYTSDTCPDCDDLSVNTRINELIPSLSFSIREHTFLSLPDITRSSSYATALSLAGEGPPDQQRLQLQTKQRSGNQKRQSKAVQKRAKHHQVRACLDREWFVRRTRSGQIYGTYAF